VERLLLLAGETVDVATVAMALPQRVASSGGATTHVEITAGVGPLAQRVAEFERATLLAELERSNGHVTNAAKALGLERSHFYKKCQQLGIDLRAERG
jgi:two-component system, NtrC family, nitrogen regulation response regulator NtrX